jgi:hypothetical protein
VAEGVEAFRLGRQTRSISLFLIRVIAMKNFPTSTSLDVPEYFPDRAISAHPFSERYASEQIQSSPLLSPRQAASMFDVY